MSLTNTSLLLPSPSLISKRFNHKNTTTSRNEDPNEPTPFGFSIPKSSNFYRDCILCFQGKRRLLVDEKWKTTATTQTRLVDNAPTRTTTVEVPVTCYQLIGVSDQAEKDEVVKAVMNLKRADIEEGYTMDAVVSRQDLLMDVRDKLLFEPEYAGNVKEKMPPKSPLRIPWAWFPGALCLLQEVGEEKLVLDIGRAALQHQDAKPYVHDLLLSMALAECAIAKFGFEKNKVSQGFEALARAQCLLKSNISLGKTTLLSQIEESLEELAPACTLELLGMPHSPENAERRLGAIAALRELLRQGLDFETPCQVQDWPCFLSRALFRLMASEILDLLPWDSIATTRKNKKSLESQNQRGVIDFNCFYRVFLAHVAVGFSTKQPELINKAKTISECLKASEGIDLKFEEAFCLFLLGQGTEAEAREKLRQLELNTSPVVNNSISGKEMKDQHTATQSLEMWLKEAVLAVFPDTQDCSPSLVGFLRGEKIGPGSKKAKGAPVTIGTISQRSLTTPGIERRDLEGSCPIMNSSRHVGSAVKQLAPTSLQTPLVATKNNDGTNASTPTLQLNRNLSFHQNKVWKDWLSPTNFVKRMTFVAILGCSIFFSLRLSGMKLIKTSTSAFTSLNPTSSVEWKIDSSLDHKVAPAGRMKNILAMIIRQLRNNSSAGQSQISSPPASLSTSLTSLNRRSMSTEEAEDLVKRWQAVKAEALGPNHHIHCLLEVLDESMLAQWRSLADAAKAKSCHWRFVLLQLTILRASIFSEGVAEMAEVEVQIEEAAELVDESQPKNPNYYSTYKIRYILKKQDDGSWRFCEGDIENPPCVSSTSRNL